MQGNRQDPAGLWLLLAGVLVLFMMPGFNALATEWQGNCAVYGGDEPMAYRAPAYFTRNAGQWKKDVSYAIVADHSAAWFGRDGVTLIRPKTGVTMPGELRPHRDQAHESATLRFVNPSPRMRIRAAETVAAKTHFYLGSDSASWHPSVSNHRTLRYEQVWDGIDIEYRPTQEGSLRQTIRIAPGADMNAIRFRGYGSGSAELEAIVGNVLDEAKQELTQMGRANAAGSEGGFRYKDTLCLTAEFNLAFQFPSTVDGIVVAPDGKVTIQGTTNSDLLPVQNPIQSTIHGPRDNYVLQFDSTGCDVVFCTYLGGLSDDAPMKNVASGANKYPLYRTDAGNIIGSFEASRGAPLTTTSYQDFPYLNLPWGDLYLKQTAYLFNLNPDGSLHGATYLGGPGIVRPGDLFVREDGIWLLGVNNYDSLTDVSSYAVIPSKPGPECWSLVLTKLDLSCSRIEYMTYLLTDTTYVSWPSDYTSKSWGHLAVNARGEAIVAMGLTSDHNVPGYSSREHRGIWIMKLSAAGDSVEI